MDINERYLDGTPNPNFLRPYVGVNQPATTESPLLNDTYRAQLAYQIDLRQEKNLLRWLGLHRLVGYKEYNDFVTRRYIYRICVRLSRREADNDRVARIRRRPETRITK